MATKTYNIFISHAWKYNDDYSGLVNLLNNAKNDSTYNFDYRNYSVPQHDPLDANNKTKLKTALTNQISPASVVLILAGMYTQYSDWIQYEIDEAVRMNKKIIAVKRWGQEKVPVQLQQVAKEVVSWQTSSIVNSIKNN